MSYEDEYLHPTRVTAQAALARLKQGNLDFLESHRNHGDISAERVEELFHEGQAPFATVITCADSRVVPEHIFMTGLGELFTVRVAGNVMGPTVVASALYACEHLNTKLLVVMGHTHCGAIESAMEYRKASFSDGALQPLLKLVADSIGNESDPYKAAVANTKAGAQALLNVPELAHLVNDDGLVVVPAIYHTHSGAVEFLS